MAKIKCVGNKNNSVLYLTDYGNITIATIFIGGKHNSYVVDGTDIHLGQFATSFEAEEYIDSMLDY